ncbi:hypothetical protein ACSTHF_19770 [Vibrio parahaemolyticus]|uniref:hypothetical protein n=1 Tax=Shewanella algae TaxID=38313 RepID=UPI0031F489D1
MWLDKEQIEKVLHQRLLYGPNKLRKYLHSLVGDDYGIYHIKTKYLLGVFILSKDELSRVNDYESKNYIPFPALYSTRDNVSAAFRLEKSRNIYLKSNNVKNSIALSLGQDCTVILEDHHQSVTTREIGHVEYNIGLGYLITFGTEIDEFSAYDYLDDLIAYSIKSWRQDNVPK